MTITLMTSVSLGVLASLTLTAAAHAQTAAAATSDVAEAGVDAASAQASADGADAQPTTAEASAEADGTIVVTGTRFKGRTAAESPVPIDSVSAEELVQGGRTDMISMLKVAVPSVNSPRPSGSSVLDLAEPVSMRGLSPGQVLVLTNGKRRPALPSLNDSNNIGRGDITYSFNNIPPAAIGRLEVLRDGAGAQYGSDAIAGVLNVLLDDSLGGTIRGTATTNYSKFEGDRRTDGKSWDITGAYGFKVGDDGFIRVSAQYLDNGAANRARPDTRQQYFGSNGTRAPSALFGSGTGLVPGNGTLDPREATIDRNLFRIGESPYTLKSVFVNSEIPVSSDIDFYSFGGYSYTKGRVPAFFRRAGQNETVRALHPNGILPITVTTFDDYSIAAGLRGGDTETLAWDVSSSLAAIKIDGHIYETNNPSLGANGPTDFDKGNSRNRIWSNSLDLAREFDLIADAPLRVAVGGEYREERYDVRPGEPGSYINGGFPILDGPSAGQPAPVGAQPAPGVSPAEAGTFKRNSKGVYAEVEQELFDRLTLVGSVRHEDYSDFGTTTDYKVAARLELTDWLSTRASFGTGFRAPSLVHSNYSVTTTNFTAGNPVSVRIFRAGEPAARLIGSEELGPEEAKTLSLGTVVTFGRFTGSVDYYNIKIDDRIVISSQFTGAAMTNLLAANGFPGISAATFLTNAVDSTTQGFDVTANYAMRLTDQDRVTLSLVANFNETELDRIAGTPAPLAAIGINTVLFDLTQQVRFTESQPKSKISLSTSWERGPFALRLTGTRYGETSVVALTRLTPAQIAALTPGYDVRLVPVPGATTSDVIQTFGAKTLIDLEASYDITEAVRFSIGANNLFDVYPDESIRSTAAGSLAGSNGADNAGTVPFNQISPIGYTGRSVFATMSVRF